MNTLMRAAATLVPVIGIINLLGGLVSGIWLAVLGQWWALSYGLIGLFVSHRIIGFLLVPSMFLAAPATRLQETGRTSRATILIGLSALYTATLITVWASAVMVLFVSRSSEGTLFALLLWSYGVATGPWAWLAREDQQSGGNEFSSMSTFFLQLGYFVGGVVLLLTETTPVVFILVLAAAMLVNWAFQLCIVVRWFRAERSSLG